MANAEPFPKGPIGFVDKEGKVQLHDNVRKWFEGQAVNQINDVGSILSGQAEIRAAAAAAQATADAAKQDTEDLGQATVGFTASVSPTVATGAAKVNILTNSVTVTPNGGTAPYTYAWSYVSGDAFEVLSPSSASTRFRSVSPSDGVYQCLVTDFTSATATVNVGVSTVSTI